MSRRYELFQFRKYQNPWNPADHVPPKIREKKFEPGISYLSVGTLLSIFQFSFVRDRIFSFSFVGKKIYITSSSFVSNACHLQFRPKWNVERHLVVFNWHNRVNNRRDNGTDMSTCKLREIHSHVRAESLVHLVAPMGVIQLIIYYHRVVFTIFVSQSFSGYGDSGIIFEQSS